MLFSFFKKLKIFFVFILLFSFSLNYSFADDGFKTFLINFLNEKASNKYNKTIVNDLKKNSYFIERVVELDRSQPEFTLSLNQYLNKAVSANRIKKAKKLYKENYSLLKKIEKKEGQNEQLPNKNAEKLRQKLEKIIESDEDCKTEDSIFI